MTHVGMNKMWERVEIARSEGDVYLYLTLLYAGEMLLKTLVAAMVSAIDDDTQRNRYGLIYKLVRTDSLGEWTAVLDEVVTGPAAQFLTFGSQPEAQEFLQRSAKGTWQYKAYDCLSECLLLIDEQKEEKLLKIDIRRVLKDFVHLRNKTRAHGAIYGNKCSQICSNLEQSLKLIQDNLSVLNLPWVYLHRNFSGKYRISEISGDTSQLNYLKKSSSGDLPNLEDGVYIKFGDLKFVELIRSDVDLFDFFFPNGQFSKSKFELLSYITGNKEEGDGTNYLLPATELPASETQGNTQMSTIGSVFTNIPPLITDYIPRHDLERKLRSAILSENHPIITLKGAGGIGKTWLTLTVIHDICKKNIGGFDAIYWFSARDIDLLSEGPKRVMPRILEQKDVALDFCQLINPNGMNLKGFDPVAYLAENLKLSALGPALFVFDNFETVKNPADFYFWLDTYIRLPNKILITTRARDFKADFDVNVAGMSDDEADDLISTTTKRLGIDDLITPAYRQQLFLESEGHPYVMKIMLGEVAKSHKLVKVERLVANKDELLRALFERTFNNLTPTAKRVFLTLCNWRSLIPQVALEAILLRPENDRMDVVEAVDELEKSSFIEVQRSKIDDEIFLSVPLVAMIFGKKKLSVSAYKSAIEADTELLKVFGSTNSSELSGGITPRIDRLFRNIGEKINKDPKVFENYLPILEFVASKYPVAWFSLSSLYQEISVIENNIERAIDAVTRFIENSTLIDDKRKGWKTLANLNRQRYNWLGEIQALVELSQLPDTEFAEISNSANRMNSLLKDKVEIDSEEKKILCTKLLDVMEKRVENEGNGTDCSRMVWLARNIRMNDKGNDYIELGLKIDPENAYIQSLAKSGNIY